MSTPSTAITLREVEIVTSDGPFTLTMEGVRAWICPTAKDQEIAMFLMQCAALKADPRKRQIYLIKPRGKDGQDYPAYTVVSRDFYLSRADKFPDFEGMESGVICSDKQGNLKDFPGFVWPPGFELVGGWANVNRKGRKTPMARVSMLEYRNDTNPNWQKRPATMVVKCAEVQALRKSFPNEFDGIIDYDPEEVPYAIMPNTEIREFTPTEEDEIFSHVAGATGAAMLTADKPAGKQPDALPGQASLVERPKKA